MVGAADLTWVQQLLVALRLDSLSEGELAIAVISTVAATPIVIATVGGVLYARRQFRIANTIKYLEEFRQPSTKRVVAQARRWDEKRGRYWRVYGLMSGVNELRFTSASGEALTIAVPFKPRRQRFALDAKYLSNYFDYAAILIKKGHIDSDLFFKQLAEVVIDNWRFLQPYIYYQRLSRLDAFAFEHLAEFEHALALLRAEPKPRTEAIDYLAALLRVARQQSVQRDAAPHQSHFSTWLSRALRVGAWPQLFAYRTGFWRTMDPRVRAEIAAFDSQIWFEWLYGKAIKWRNRKRRVRDWFAPRHTIAEAIRRIGADAP